MEYMYPFRSLKSFLCDGIVVKKYIIYMLQCCPEIYSFYASASRWIFGENQLNFLSLSCPVDSYVKEQHLRWLLAVSPHITAKMKEKKTLTDILAQI